MAGHAGAGTADLGTGNAAEQKHYDLAIPWCLAMILSANYFLMKHRIEGGTLILAMQEDMLSSNVDLLSISCKNAIEATTDLHNLTVDLAQSRMVDSRGVYLLINLCREALSVVGNSN